MSCGMMEVARLMVGDQGMMSTRRGHSKLTTDQQTPAELTFEQLPSMHSKDPVQDGQRGWCVPRPRAVNGMEQVAGHRRGEK